MEACQRIERSIITKFRKPIWGGFMHGLREYRLIQPGDHIAACISGGKDSFLMAKCLQEVQRHGDVPFQLSFLVMDPGYHPQNRRLIEENAALLELPIQIFETDIFEAVSHMEHAPCYMCARMRRGYLYKHAQRLGANKIALGHHFDDVIETVLLSMFYGVSNTTISIAWLLRYPAHIQPVTGTMNTGRLLDCVKAAEITLTREEWYEIYLAAGNILP